jgi:hypothetical protein
LSLALLGTEEKATDRATLIVIRDLFMARLVERTQENGILGLTIAVEIFASRQDFDLLAVLLERGLGLSLVRMPGIWFHTAAATTPPDRTMPCRLRGRSEAQATRHGAIERAALKGRAAGIRLLFAGRGCAVAVVKRADGSAVMFMAPRYDGCWFCGVAITSAGGTITSSQPAYSFQTRSRGGAVTFAVTDGP